MKVLFVLIVTLSLILTSCYGVYTGTYLSTDNPEFFQRCPSDQISNPQEHAFNAMISSLADENWVLEQSVSKLNTIKARTCVYNEGDYLTLKTEYCLLVEFQVHWSGSIRARNPGEVRFQQRYFSFVEKKMKRLQRNYAELRCYSEEELQRRSPKSNSF